MFRHMDFYTIISLSCFQCGIWHSVHVDDLHPDSNMLEIQDLRGRTIGDICSREHVCVGFVFWQSSVDWL